MYGLYMFCYVCHDIVLARALPARSATRSAGCAVSPPPAASVQMVLHAPSSGRRRFVANSLRRSASACAASSRPREAARARGQRQKRPSPIMGGARRHPVHWTHVRTRGPRDAQPLPPPLDANSNPALNPHPQQVFIETLREQSGER